mmetsp:Transcript_101239/g.159688  ORF Transcript_101239/g.159688 Transcript_101239/m.159688 type:complete len:341 (-) Transcript_101239:97-1119(-)
MHWVRHPPTTTTTTTTTSTTMTTTRTTTNTVDTANSTNVYERLSSGYCPLERQVSETDCLAAAKTVGAPQDLTSLDGVFESGFEGIPQGCTIKQSVNYVIWFGPSSSSEAPCGSRQVDCICKADGQATDEDDNDNDNDDVHDDDDTMTTTLVANSSLTKHIVNNGDPTRFDDEQCVEDDLACEDDRCRNRPAVRCCGLNGETISDQQQVYGCHSKKTFDEAQAICSSNNLRLCTNDELENGVTARTGCNMDRLPVWTSTPCSGLLVQSDPPPKSPSECCELGAQGRILLECHGKCTCIFDEGDPVQCFKCTDGNYTDSGWSCYGVEEVDLPASGTQGVLR